MANKVLGIHREMQSLKLEKVKTLATTTLGKRFSPEELGSAAAMISQAAEEEVLERRVDELGKGGEVYHAAMARYSRDENFRISMAEQDAEHRRALVAALRAEASSVG